jgi:Endonuclease/Exonuclease/phosphatase family
MGPWAVPLVFCLSVVAMVALSPPRGRSSPSSSQSSASLPMTDPAHDRSLGVRSSFARDHLREGSAGVKVRFRLAALNAHCCLGGPGIDGKAEPHRGIDCGDWRGVGEICSSERLAGILGPQGVAEYVEEGLRADIVTLNEVPGRVFARDLARRLGFAHHYVWSNTTSGGHKNKHKVILSRFPLANVREVAAKQGPRRWRPASILFADAEVVPGTYCTIGSLHVPNGDPNDWLGDLFQREMGRTGCGVFAGDYNNMLAHMPRLLTDFRSTFREAGTDVQRRFTSNNEKQVIDHILFAAAPRYSLRVLASEIMELDNPGRPSDHKPIWADFELTTTKASRDRARPRGNWGPDP